MNDIPTTVKNKALVEKKREQIVLSAIKLFSRKGFHQTTLRELSEDAGISYGNIYDYVGSKTDIFILIHQYLCEKAFEVLHRSVENISDPLDALRRMIRAEFTLMDQWADGILLLYQEGHVLEPPLLHRFLQKEHGHVKIIEDLVGRCLEEGALRECNPSLVANLIKVMVDGWVLKRWDLRGKATSTEAEHFILELLWQGLLSDGTREQEPRGEGGSLSGKKALVVGGTTPLVSAVCAGLAAENARVCAFLTAEPEPDQDRQGKLPPWGPETHIYTAGEHGPLREGLIRRIQDQMGPLDIIVEDVGLGSLDSPSENEAPERRAHMAALLGAKLAGAQSRVQVYQEEMTGRPGGRVVHIAPWAWDQYWDPITFATVMAGTLGLNQALAKALAPEGVNVNCLVPGHIKTPRLTEAQKDRSEEALAGIPLARLGELSDVINALLFLARDDSRYLSGQVLRVTGGY